MPCGSEAAISLRTRHLREAEHLDRALDKAFPDAWNRAVSEAADPAGPLLQAVWTLGIPETRLT